MNDSPMREHRGFETEERDGEQGRARPPVSAREDEDEPTIDSWVVGPVLKVVAEFEESARKYPPIAMGTPDPYEPRATQQ